MEMTKPLAERTIEVSRFQKYHILVMANYELICFEFELDIGKLGVMDYVI